MTQLKNNPELREFLNAIDEWDLKTAFDAMPDIFTGFKFTNKLRELGWKHGDLQVKRKHLDWLVERTDKITKYTYRKRIILKQLTLIDVPERIEPPDNQAEQNQINTCIRILKAKGYRIQKPVVTTTFEEV